MKVQGKVWGRTFDLFNKNNVEVHYIEVLEDGYCSKHCHKSKYNTFIILEGTLEVTIWRGESPDVTVLTDGMEYTVEPGIYHMFRARNDVKALEIYHVELDRNDIVRENVGGLGSGWTVVEGT